MSKKNKIAIAVTVASLLMLVQGCNSYQEIEETQEKVESAISQELALINKLKGDQRQYQNITLSGRIFVPPMTPEETKKPSWWFEPTAGGKGVHLPMVDALNMILDDGVNVRFGRNVDKGALVSYRGATAGDAIDSIADASGYSYRLLADNKLVWSMYETRTFPIAASPGIDYFGQGKGKGEAASSEANINATTEYVNAAGEVDVLEQIYQELKTYSSFRKSVAFTTNSYKDVKGAKDDEEADKTDDIAVEDIPIFLNRGASTITVRDTPTVLDQMEQLVNQKNNLYRTNVYIEIDIIEVKLTNEGQQALDVSMVVADLGKYGLGLNSGVTSGTAASQIGRASTTLPTNVISAELTQGRLSGSKLLMEALSTYGAVSSRTMPRQTLQHNSIAKLRDFENVFYINERSSNTTANVGTEGSIKQKDLDVGFSLYLMPTVFKKDVIMRMATNLSSLLELTRNGDTGTTDETKDSKATYVESPRTSNKDFMSKFTVTSGDTLVLSGLSREIKTLRRGKGVSELIASSEFGKSERIETIITVTPQILRPKY